MSASRTLVLITQATACLLTTFQCPFRSTITQSQATFQDFRTEHQTKATHTAYNNGRTKTQHHNILQHQNLLHNVQPPKNSTITTTKQQHTSPLLHPRLVLFILTLVIPSTPIHHSPFHPNRPPRPRGERKARRKCRLQCRTPRQINSCSFTSGVDFPNRLY